MRVAARGGVLQTSCDGPYAADGDYRKHEWATLRVAEMRGLLSAVDLSGLRCVPRRILIRASAMTTDAHAPPPAPARAFDLLAGLAKVQVLSALVRTHVVETLAEGPCAAEDLARACGVETGVLARTLRFAALAGLVEARDGKYALTDVGRCFVKGTPGSLYGSATFIGAPPWRDSWNQFEHCLRTGGAAFDHVHGKPFFQFLEENPEYGQPFHHYMTQMTTMAAPLVAAAYDFGAFATICDVGGGQGLLLRKVLERAERANGILFDTKSALEGHVLGELASRVTVQAGSFFESVPAADCYILKTIVHDWSDDKARGILANCRKSLKPGGRVVLVEQVVEEPAAAPQLFYDLHMLVMLGGRERTEAELRALLESAGLKLARIVATPSPMKLIEATA